MNDKKLKDFRYIIESLLFPNEKLLHIYKATTGSIYVCIIQDDLYYKVFRISDHQSRNGYKQGEFYIDEDELTLKSQIRDYLYISSDWYKLKSMDMDIIRIFNWSEVSNLKIFKKNKYLVANIQDNQKKINYEILDSHFIKRISVLIQSGLLNQTSAGFINSTHFISYMCDHLKSLHREKKIKLSYNDGDLPYHYLYYVNDVPLEENIEAKEVTLKEKIVNWFNNFILGDLKEYSQTSIENTRIAIENYKSILNDKSKKELKSKKKNSNKNKSNRIDEIEEKWKKNIKKRTNTKIKGIISDEQFAQLIALKEELIEDNK